MEAKGTSGKLLKLQSKEGDIIETDRRVMSMSNLIKDMLEDNQDNEEVIPIPKYSAESLILALDYCKRADYNNEGEVKKPVLDLKNVYPTEWEKEFFNGLTNDQLFELIEVSFI